MRPTPEARDDNRAALEALRAQLAETERAAARKARPKARSKKPSGDPYDEPPGDTPDEPFHGPPGDPPGEQDEESSPGRGSKRGASRAPSAVGGLVARTRRGPAGATWWSRRFLGALESVMAGGHMELGRAYARKGMVTQLVIGPGVVAAVVQGAGEEPYAVRLEMPVVPSEDWDRIVAVLATSAEYAARMLAGELPEEVEQVFESEGASLLPAPHARLVTECSCPGWENPCPHVAAVCYLVAEELERDPFSLLAWRGRAKGVVLGELRARRSDLAAPSPAVPAGSGAAQPATDGRDLVGRFWIAGPELAHVRVRPEAAAVPAAALRLAPRGTIRARGGDLADVLAPAYRAIVAAAAARSRR